MRLSPSAPTGLLAIAVLCSVGPASPSSLAAASLQEPVVLDDERPAENALNKQKRLLREKQTEGLRGSWDLLRYETAGAVVDSSEISGAAMFAEGFFSLVIHATGREEDTGQEMDMAQAGIFRFEVDDFSNLRSLTIIGHATPPEIDVAEAEISVIEEQAGGMREYHLQVDGDRAVMQHFSGTKLTFLRMAPSALSAPEIARLGEELEEQTEDPETPGAPSELLLEEQVVGGWYLSGYLARGIPIPDDTITGAAIISDGYMSLVIHAFDYLVDDIGDPVGEVLLAQAGLYRYRIKDSKMLQTSTVIGHSTPEVGIDYEAAGGLRQYDASIEDGALILRALDGTALRFVRMTPRQFTANESATLNRYQRGLDLINDD